MAAVILPFALATGRQVRAPAQDPTPRPQGWMTLDLDGAVSPLRGALPRAAGTFDRAPGLPAKRRVPAQAILAIGRRIRRAANTPHVRAVPDAVPARTILQAPQAATEAPQAAAEAPRTSVRPPARPRMPRKHKLMLVTAVAVLYTGGLEARRHWKPRAVLIEAPHARTHAIAALPARMPAA
ncbi:hypothetical protein DK419_18355 [Methylobacterium terrae]|uniref:Uncharacterized protein n=1 Tax=Methylobacterium terrae TaxID=2202827 RepID=A0A2U8WPD9_9HYPH|nr:hypothetical protein [Methylobacterium terrae]AWN48049.1 hypothetical protein DK419_18355 [Methylobacterium terrae]